MSILITGPRGSGKTAALVEFAIDLTAANTPVFLVLRDTLHILHVLAGGSHAAMTTITHDNFAQRWPWVGIRPRQAVFLVDDAHDLLTSPTGRRNAPELEDVTRARAQGCHPYAVHLAHIAQPHKVFAFSMNTNHHAFGPPELLYQEVTP